MKAYLLTTGALFALLSVLHVWRVAAEWPHADKGSVAGMAALVVLTAGLAFWAWRLLRALPSQPTGAGPR